MSRIFPYYRQHDAMDCGPACLRMIAGHYGIIYSKTPLVLHRFSQKIGKTRLLNILQGFYGEFFETGVINMEVFERHLKKGGVSEEQYRQLVRDLSNPIMNVTD